MSKINIKKKINRSFYGNALSSLILILLGAFMVLPLIYTIVNSFKPMEEFFIFPPKFYVINPTLFNFIDLFNIATSSLIPLTRYLFNSIFVSIVSTTGQLTFSLMAAYVISKHEFPGKKLYYNIVIVSLLFTSKILFLPQYIVIAKLGWINTYMAVISPIFAMTLGTFLLIQFISTIPNPMIESARIDGASEMRICWQIVGPNVKPAMITVIIFAFQASWNATGMNVIFREEYKMLPTYLNQITASGIARAGAGAAASLILLIPPVILFLLLQSKIILTMSNSGIKE